MSRPRFAPLLLFVVAAIRVIDPGVAAAASRHHHHPPLLDCGPAPILSKNDDATFRADLATAIAALPSIVTTVPDAFAIARIGSAVARGACFGANVSTSPAMARACQACLSNAARDVTGGCRSSGRAGVWRNECFLSYADSNASTAREDAFHGWFYAGPSTNVVPDGGACLTDRAVDCDQCWHDSARAAAAVGWWQRIQGEEALVIGYSCFLRVRISTLPKGSDEPDADGAKTFGLVIFYLWLDLVFGVAAWTVGIVFVRIIRIVRALPQVNNG